MEPFTTRETATILAALRYWQNALAATGTPPITGHFAEETPLTPAEIDDLCERLNLGR